MYGIDLTFSMCILKVLLEGSVSQFFKIMAKFLFYDKKRVTFCHFLHYKFLHFIK